MGGKRGEEVKEGKEGEEGEKEERGRGREGPKEVPVLLVMKHRPIKLPRVPDILRSTRHMKSPATFLSQE